MTRRPPGSTRTATLFPYTTLCGSEGWRLDVDLDQRVAGRTAAHARHALALEAQRLAVLGARRDAHVQRLAVGQLDAFFGALGGLQAADRPGVGVVGARPPHTARAPAEEVGEDGVYADVAADF